MRQQIPLIVGGGPAGSAAAIVLAQAGTRATVLERQRETSDAICGGFLSWRTLETLASLGVSREALGGHPITTLVIASTRASARAVLPATARGVSRHRLDTLLLTQAAAVGAAIERGVSVKALGDDQQLRLADGAVLASDSLFLATGKYDLRGLGRADPSQVFDPTLGLRLIIPPHPTLSRLVGGCIELHLFRGGYAGLQLREDGSANLCLAVQKSRLAAAGGDPRTLLRTLGTDSSLLGERLAFADLKTAPDAIAAVPYGWRARNTKIGQFRLGDQAAVIPSLAGEGNGIALISGIRAANAWLSGGADQAPAYQAELARATRRPLELAKWVRKTGNTQLGAVAILQLMSAFPALSGFIAHHTRIS